ncbi:MAG: hypothetical protein OEO20_11020 [Gemmatimonadota bacterium]|nr:hypothetical protein [Gemmatimonadota bacterium]MDH3366745.1 hypothetical protein [Gemmatimonadota bacterium]MDH3478824.1 hypothetical protein [Gemmatimonadota bacterium]MDH3571889.1 hypothetical protein [Gemmatimonadota bacterium]MDH5550053.1 hypothetical protein [Gemmatimonadota bacterium]
MRPDLYRMFYPLDRPAQNEWAEIVQLSQVDYVACLADKAQQYDCRQEVSGDAIRWHGKAGNLELMLFRIPDPGNLSAVRAVYAAIAEAECPIAFAFVNQRGDHRDAWDVFQFSRLSYLCHCNRVSGPGSECEP